MTSFGQAPWINQVVEGVARLVETAVRQLAHSAGPGMNEQPLADGGGYAHPPITEHDIRSGYLQQVQPAQQRHLTPPRDAQVANQAQAAYEGAQQQYAQGIAAPELPQQVEHLQGAAQGMDQFASLSGVQNPMERQQRAAIDGVVPSLGAIVLPPGVAASEQPVDGDPNPMPVMW